MISKGGESIGRKKGDFNQVRYINEFTRANYRRYNLQISIKETDVIAKLDSQENKTKYIVDLIKKDIEK